FVLLLDRVGLYPQPIVLVQDSVDGGRVILDRLDPSERVAQRCERLGQWRVRRGSPDSAWVEPWAWGGFRAGASRRSACPARGRPPPGDAAPPTDVAG